MHNNNVSLHINIVHNTPLTPPLSNDVHKSAKLLASYFQLLVSSSESQLLSPFYCILPDMGSRERSVASSMPYACEPHKQWDNNARKKKAKKV